MGAAFLGAYGHRQQETTGRQCVEEAAPHLRKPPLAVEYIHWRARNQVPSDYGGSTSPVRLGSNLCLFVVRGDCCCSISRLVRLLARVIANLCDLKVCATFYGVSGDVARRLFLRGRLESGCCGEPWAPQKRAISSPIHLTPAQREVVEVVADRHEARSVPGKPVRALLIMCGANQEGF